MKKLASLGAACALMLALSTPASAGYIQTGVASPQPSPSPAATAAASPAVDGGVAGDGRTDAAPPDTVTGAALDLVMRLLSLL